MGTGRPQFCADSFWNSSFYDFNGWPRLTDCFLNTVLVWVPCAFLWCPLPFYLVVLARKGEVTPLPVTWLSSAKTFSSMVLSMVALVSLIQDSKLLTDSGSDVPPVVTYLASVLRLVSYLCTAFLTQHERRRQVITSGLQFVFWSLLMLCDIVPLYTAVIEEDYNDDILKFVLLCVTVAIESIQTILFCFSEAFKETQTGYHQQWKRPCPEVTASFPSRMLFGWITKYIYLGWQRDLTEADLFDLNPRDSSDVLVPSFEREWELERERFRNKQRGKPGNGTSADSTITSLQLLPKDSIEGDIHLPATVLETRSLVPSCSAHNSRGKLGVSTAYGTLYRPGDDEVKQETPSLLRVLVKLVGPRLILGLFANAVSEGILILCPVLLGLLIEQVTSPDNNDKQTRSGYVLAVLMFVVYMVRTLLSNFSYWCSQVVGIQLKTILIAAIYKKSLTMNSAARRLAASGEITNLMSVDCQRIQDAMFFVVAWTTPLQVIIVVGVLYLYIGPSVFAGVIVLLLLVPLNSYISICQKKLNISNLKFKDKRLRLTNDMLSGMRVVKMYAWEPSFKKLITELRSEETKVLLRMSYLNMFMSVCGYFTPFLVTLATFATFVVVSPDNHLDARRVFVTLALLNLLRVPLDILTFLIPMTVQSLVSVQRINKFLCCEDLDTDSVTCDADAVDAISIRNGTFTWDKHYEPVLKNIDISVGVGRLVAVVGHVGSGKSSLISSLLGETEKVSGKVTIKSSVAYVPQQAWIQNATIRDNVLFGKLFNLQRYQQVLRACALEPDLEILPAGDMTEIGERGINLSGGQKQRVSLARAVYSDSDIYLLDDPLSAVDSHVGKHIFTEVIGPNGLIGHKTRVLVTHGIHWLPMVDEIIVLSDNGISEKGSYDTLMSHNGPFARFLKLHLQQREESEEEEDPEISTLIKKIRENVVTVTSNGATSGEDLTCKDYSRRRKSTRTTSKSSWMTDSTKNKFSTCHLEEDTSQENNYRLVKEETIEKGNVKWSVFLTYIRAAGAVPFTASILFFLIFQAINASGNFWLSRWTDDNFLATSHGNATLRHNYKVKNDYYLMVFGMFGIGQIVTLVLSNFLIWVRTVVASQNLHSRLLASVLRSPMVFFDTTPVGRIINRFSRDIDTIDNILPNNIQESVSIGTMVLVTIIVISISTPLFIFLVIPVIILYFLIQTFYIPTSRQLKRMESVTHSPIYVHFSETISGGATIRAYRAVDRFIEEIKRRVDRNQSLYFASLSAHRWMSLNVEIITNLIVFGAAICSIVTPGIGGGTLGFSVTYAMQMSKYLGWMVRMISDLVTNMVSVERVKEYSQLESEAPWSNPLRRPDPSWPERGRLLFSEYSTRYRPGLDLVLRDISFVVEAGQKVGIVGRTGAGKSSLTLSLFRLIEACNGCIIIDGVNIADIGLHDLRSRITILPQDPVLFSGTLRMNLDPLSQYSDDQIWKSLETAQLKRFVEELPEKLNHQVGEGGQKLR
ncbi:LOW QUALITY PROTEIN: multidrug resistance-associated protein 1-like [Pomacea canaliculata]|uniref:LOW QUALITY PROTEIN: multidrug resistance-associated protein 1-like n=1 Tax=Pomacea canaliculata TaxID=400727 RepID=UPI000D73939B|nr:LOW QUALITY PROTEIN: multidrug resistance-associated protein 1-like [Pomacea canaliculata]